MQAPELGDRLVVGSQLAEQSHHFHIALAFCAGCALKTRCTDGRQRLVSRHLHETALERMQQRATPAMMRLRRSTVEHPFASLKYRILGDARFLLRGLQGAQAEISLATMVYNLKRMMKVISAPSLLAALTS